MAREKKSPGGRKKQEKPAESLPSIAPVAVQGARISRRASDRLRAGHVWVYASDVEAVSVGKDEAPVLLPVADNRGLLLGTALYSPASQITLRLISREAIDTEQWLGILQQRLRKAGERRVGGVGEKNDALPVCVS